VIVGFPLMLTNWKEEVPVAPDGPIPPVPPDVGKIWTESFQRLPVTARPIFKTPSGYNSG
jgi:hypothetical protein